MSELGLAEAPLEAGNQASAIRQKAIVAVKIAISAGLLAVIVATERPSALWDRVDHANLVLVITAVALLLIQYPLAAIRWRLVLAALGYRARTTDLMRVVWTGQFISQVLPTFLAGDGVRVWCCRRQGMPLRTALSSILWDRALGFSGIALLSLIMAPRLVHVATGSTAATAVPLLSAIALVALAVALALGVAAGSISQRFPLVRRFDVLFDGWRVARQPRELAGIAFLATATNVIASVSAWLLARSIGVDLTLIDAVTLIPAALFASLLPISIAGWGVREITLSYLLGLAGIGSADAVTVSLLLGGALMLASLPGVLNLGHVLPGSATLERRFEPE